MSADNNNIYCHYLGTLATSLDRVASLPKFMVEYVDKGICVGASSTHIMVPASDKVLNMPFFFQGWTKLIVLMYCVTSAAAFVDNWGDPARKVHVHDETIQEVTSRCEFDFQPMSSVLDGATFNFYPSTEDWATYKGTDLVPENKHLYLRTGDYPWGRKFATNKETTILAAECDVENHDESTWSIQRIGPFKSTGNYDWWQFAWNDVLRFKEKLKSTPDGLYVLNHFAAPVNSDGDALDFPPIHIHHVHVSPGPHNQY